MSEGDQQSNNKVAADPDVLRSSLRDVTSTRKNHLQTLFKERRLIFALLKKNTRRHGRRLYDVEESVSDDEEPRDVEQLDHPVDIKPLSGPLVEIMKKLDEYEPVRQRMQSINIPVEVRIRNLTFTVQINQNAKVETVFSTSMFYRLYKWYKVNMLGKENIASNLVSKHVLDDISLEFEPGKMYLILGPPASGKTSLMRCIAGLLHPQKGEVIGGNVTYNGREMKDSDGFVIENAFAFISQLDKHAPRLTVEETFEFAFQCKSGGRLISGPMSPDEMEAEERALRNHFVTDIILTALGLKHVKDTFVGDNNVRGVSGGQRRRVTVGEMLMSTKPFMCGDEISTGLDAASTFDMIQTILHFGRVRKLTRVISLLQPSPETVSLFDEIILLAEGKLIFSGPVGEVESYFGSLGYRAPEYLDTTDFLQMITTEDGATLYDPPEEIKSVYPEAPTISELAEKFRQSKFGQKIKEKLDGPSEYVWKENESEHGSQVSGLAAMPYIRKRYANNFFRSTRLILSRFVRLWIRDRNVILAGAVKNILMGASVGGVFFDTVDPVSIEGAMFQAGLFVMLGAMQSSMGLINDRIIFYKHNNANFYSVWPFVFGRTLSQIPQIIVDTLMFGILLYYTVGLAGREDFDNLLVYLAVLFSFAVLMAQQLSVFASFATPSGAQAYSACVILLMMLFGGFIVAPASIPDYYSFLYWLNPFAWMFRSLVVLEFRSNRWDDPDSILTSLGFTTPSGEPFGSEWIAYGFYFMTPYFLLCCFLTGIGLSSRAGDSVSAAPRSMAKPIESESETPEGDVDIPFTPVTLSFHSISYEVPASTKNESLKLLNNINGVFRPRRCVALMGNSGAGKTTLLDVIALRKKTGTVKGDVLLNGFPQDPVSFRRCSGYVEQFDVQSPQLTVVETILFSARLRLDSSIVTENHVILNHVRKTMHEMELNSISDALVGTDETGGLSFEEKKRLSIAVELAASPSVLFLDEPTSGLDARSALLVMKCLRRISDTGRTICATIHQPSSTVFEMFDDLLLLQKGGEVVYHGELGASSSTLISYFETKGAPKIEVGENPANWMLRVLSLESMGDLSATYRNSENFTQMMQDLDRIKGTQSPDTEIKYDTVFAVSKVRREELVNARLRTIYWRSPTYNLTRLSVSGIIAFILGSVFLRNWRRNQFTEIEIRARLSVIFLAFIITGIMSIVSVLPVMQDIKMMFRRHADAGMYGSQALGIALGVAEKWFILAGGAIFTAIFLSSSHINNAPFSAGFWGFFTFNLAIYSYIGQAFVALVQSPQTAFVLASVYIGLNNFFSGLIVRPQFMVGTFFQVPYSITPGRYVYEGLVVTLYRTTDDTVVADPNSEFFDHLLEKGECNESSNEICIGSIDDYIESFFGGEFSEDNIIRNALILGGILIFTRFLTWLALEYIRN